MSRRKSTSRQSFVSCAKTATYGWRRWKQPTDSAEEAQKAAGGFVDLLFRGRTAEAETYRAQCLISRDAHGRQNRRRLIRVRVTGRPHREAQTLHRFEQEQANLPANTHVQGIGQSFGRVAVEHDRIAEGVGQVLVELIVQPANAFVGVGEDLLGHDLGGSAALSMAAT